MYNTGSQVIFYGGQPAITKMHVFKSRKCNNVSITKQIDLTNGPRASGGETLYSTISVDLNGNQSIYIPFNGILNLSLSGATALTPVNVIINNPSVDGIDYPVSLLTQPTGVTSTITSSYGQILLSLTPTLANNGLFQINMGPTGLAPGGIY
jgi:hypothetical protein